MRLYIKNKMISLRGSSYVLDESGQKVFEVKGRWLSPTHKKHVYDMAGNLLFTVRNKYWHFLRKSALVYDRRDGGKGLFAQIKSRFFGGYDVKKCEEDISLEVEFLRGVHVYKDGREIAWYGQDPTFESAFIRDSFTLEVFEPQYTELMVAFVIAYDNIRDAHQKD